jgi:hypothetical protein
MQCVVNKELYSKRVRIDNNTKRTFNHATYTGESTMRIGKTLKPNWKLGITRANNILNLEVLV